MHLSYASYAVAIPRKIPASHEKIAEVHGRCQLNMAMRFVTPNIHATRSSAPSITSPI